MNRLRSRRLATVTASVVGLTVLGCSSAVAYWSVTGSGQGAAEVRSFTAPTVGPGSVSGPDLYPGLSANGTSTGATLSVTASNPNPFPVTVTVSQDGQATGCTTPDLTVRTTSFTLPASSGPVDRPLAFTVGMGTGASDDCQGRTITVPLSTTSTTG